MLARHGTENGCVLHSLAGETSTAAMSGSVCGARRRKDNRLISASTSNYYTRHHNVKGCIAGYSSRFNSCLKIKNERKQLHDLVRLSIRGSTWHLRSGVLRHSSCNTEYRQPSGRSLTHETLSFGHFLSGRNRCSLGC